jgi:hypothetical protein
MLSQECYRSFVPPLRRHYRHRVGPPYRARLRGARYQESHLRHEGVTRASQGCYEGVTMDLQGCHHSVVKGKKRVA